MRNVHISELEVFIKLMKKQKFKLAVSSGWNHKISFSVWKECNKLEVAVKSHFYTVTQKKRDEDKISFKYFN